MQSYFEISGSPTFRDSFIHVLRLNESQTGYDVISGEDIGSSNSSLLFDAAITPVGPGSVLWNGSTSALGLAVDTEAFQAGGSLAFYVAVDGQAGRLASVQMATASRETTVTVRLTPTGLQLQVSSQPDTACPDVLEQLGVDHGAVAVWGTLLLARTATSVSLSHSSGSVTAVYNCLPTTSDPVTSTEVSIGDDHPPTPNHPPVSIRVACFLAYRSSLSLLPEAVEEQCLLPRVRQEG